MEQFTAGCCIMSFEDDASHSESPLNHDFGQYCVCVIRFRIERFRIGKTFRDAGVRTPCATQKITYIYLM